MKSGRPAGTDGLTARPEPAVARLGVVNKHGAPATKASASAPRGDRDHHEAGPVSTDRILTLPNLISAFRLLLVPVVAVLIFNGQFLFAVLVLAVAGISDWLDGVVARAFNQTSRLGQMLDPAADRLFIAVALIGLAYHEVLPWWLVVAVFSRDIIVGLTVPFLFARGYPAYPVHDVGKAGTFALMYAFPLVLLAQVDFLEGHIVSQIAWMLGWAAALWGVYLYWVAGIAYLNQFRKILRSGARASERRNSGSRASDRRNSGAPAP